MARKLADANAKITAKENAITQAGTKVSEALQFLNPIFSQGT